MFGKANMYNDYVIKTGMPQLTITDHLELYPGVLNCLNKKNASHEMSEYLHDKIRKHATQFSCQFSHALTQ